MSKRCLIVVTACLAFTLAACGADDDSSSVETTAVAAGGADAPATLSDADIEFAQGMIAHHEQAIEMAEIAIDPTVSAGADVVDLATRIQAAQEPEIEQMTAWLTAAGESITMDMSDGHDMSSMPGMMSMDDMDALDAMSGADFDQRWLEMMIVHHEGAISQSETVKANGANADVLALADQIITAQQAEITEMQGLLGG
jgi:uncharacterized protein (DUF305 family)